MANPNYVIECYNRLTNRFTVQDFREGKLKGLYIPKERKALEDECGVDDVNLVFGEPTHLEKAEAMFLRIQELEEEGRFDKKIKYGYLIDISYQISNACGKELDSNNPVWDKYATLYTGIPIEMFRYNLTPLFYPGLKREIQRVTAEELKTARIWMNSVKSENDSEKGKKLYFEYIFELVYISLKKIFEEVKTEIMDK